MATRRKEARMVGPLIERLTLQACMRCGGELRPYEVSQFHVTLACVMCGCLQYVPTAPEQWS